MPRSVMTLVPDQQDAVAFPQVLERLQPSRKGVVGQSCPDSSQLSGYGLPDDGLQGIDSGIDHGPRRPEVQDMVDISPCHQCLRQFGSKAHLASAGSGLTQEVRVLWREGGQCLFKAIGLPMPQRRQSVAICLRV